MNKVTSFLSAYKWWIMSAVVAMIFLPKVFRFLAGEEGGGAPVGPPTPSFKCNSAAADRDAAISQGTKNSNAVCYLQQWLNTYYNAKLTVDGNFGAKTRAALDLYRPQTPLAFTLNQIGA
jgi:hypothetical protein